MNDLIEKIKQWAFERDLLQYENHSKQMMKVMEELGELNSAILHQDKDLTVDAFGDVLVTLIILAEQLGFDLEECLGFAYMQIKNRKGLTINGTFIKEE